MTDSKISAIAPEPPKLSPLTPGAMLRDAREASGQTHAAVGEALHLTVHYIKALENDDYSKLPGLIFVKGYIRSYGTYLKMDVDALIRSYDANVGTVESANQSQINPYDRRQHQRRRNDQSFGWALVTGFIVIVALAAGWWFVGRDEAPAETTAQTSAPAGNNSTAANAVANTAARAAQTQTNPAFAATIPSTTQNATAASMSMSANAGATAPDSSAFNPTATSTTTGVAAPLAPGLNGSALNGTALNGTPLNSTTLSSTAPNSAMPGAEALATSAAPAQSVLENTLPTADVTSAATAITPTGEVVQSAMNGTVNSAMSSAMNSTVNSAVNNVASAVNEQAALRTTVTEDGITIIPAADGSRQVSMFHAGNDELLLRFAGNSWVEVDDGSNVRLYSDMLNTGDTLTIQGTAPFQVLLGNARNVEVNFNNSAIDIASSIRTDNTARVLLSNSSNQAPVSGSGVAQ